MKGAGPFYFKGNNIGVLMIHGGGGGTAADLKPLAKELHDKMGYTVSVPLLPGYGSTPEDLKETTIVNWTDFLKKETEILKSKTNEIFVGGHSMGGLLTFILASRIRFDGIFSISTPIDIRGIGLKIAPLLKFVKKYAKINVKQMKNETNGRWVGYQKIPLNLASKIKKLQKMTKSSINQIKTPTILFQGKYDEVIKESSLNYLYENLSSKIITKVWLEQSKHQILNCPDQDTIVKKLTSFINRVTKEEAN